MNYSKLTVSAIVLLGAADAYAISCAAVPECADYQYTNRAKSCTNGYVACPWNVSMVRCDEEGHTNDFKYSLTPNSSLAVTGWTELEEAQDRFIVRVMTTNDETKCYTTTVGKQLSQRLGNHSHTSTDYDFVTSAKRESRKVASQQKAGTCYEKAGTSEYNKSLGNTTGITGSGTGGSELYPVHKVVRGYTYTAIADNSPDGTYSCADAALTCADMGYVDTESNCPGSMIRCPLDKTQVKCDLQALAGEIKFSYREGDHDGWLKCDGRALSTLGTKYTTSELATILSKGDFASKLPDYRGHFLRIGTSPSNASVKDNLPSHTHEVKVFVWTSVSSGDTIWDGRQSSQLTFVTNTSPTKDSSPSVTPSQGGNETAPEHVRANAFIYSGRLNNPTDYVKVVCNSEYTYSTFMSAYNSCKIRKQIPEQDPDGYCFKCVFNTTISSGGPLTGSGTVVSVTPTLGSGSVVSVGGGGGGGSSVVSCGSTYPLNGLEAGMQCHNAELDKVCYQPDPINNGCYKCVSCGSSNLVKINNWSRVQTSGIDISTLIP